VGVDQEDGGAGAGAELFFEVGDVSVEGESAIELRGGLSFEDTMRFQYFQALRRIWWLVALVAILLFIVAPVLLALFVNTYPPVVSWDWVLTNAAPVAYGLLAIMFLVLVAPYVCAKKQFAAQSQPPKILKVSFTSEGISSEGTGFSSKVAWTFVKTVRETESFFLLYYSASAAMVVPKRCFNNPEEMERWRNLFGACVDPKVIERPSFAGRWC
jgi:hypothetical protein